MTVSGKTAVVTGGARGIGRAIAQRLLDGGARVLIADRDAEVGGSAAQALGAGCASVVCDVSDAAACDRLLQEAAEIFGPPDILICNAGIVRKATPIEEISPETWNAVLGVNLMGCVYPTRAFAPMAKTRGSGRIIYMASVGGQVGGVSAEMTYAVSKAGVLGLTKAVARQLAPHGITVNAVAPGAIVTGMTDTLEYAPTVKQGIPLGDYGEVNDIAEAVAYLASDAAKYVTGATLDVNGGMFMR